MAKDWHGSKPSRLSPGRWVAIAAIAGSVAVALPFAHVIGPHAAAFTPSIVTLTTVTCLLAAFLMFQEVLSGRDGRLAGIGAAYLFAALSVIPVGLATPGVWTGTGLLDASQASGPIFWAVWHGGWALMLIGAFAFGPALQRSTVTQCDRRRLVALCVGGTVLLTVAGAAGVLLIANHLTASPDAFRIPGTSAALIFALTLVAGFVSGNATRNSRGVERVVVVAMVASLADVALTGTGRPEYSVGWYAAHIFAFLTGAVVVAALLINIVQLYRQSERDKHVLEDEALRLLQETRAAQYREDRVRRIIENAADAYIEIDRSGVIRAWNTKAADMFGHRANDAIGKDLAALLMSQEGRSQLLDFVEAFWVDNDRFDGARAEIIATHINGVEFPVEVTMWVDESDFDPQMNFFLRDITTRREADEQLQRALEDERQAVLQLQQLDRAKTDFVSSVSHELRSPLTSTLGFLELLADGDAGQLTSEQIRMIDIASRNARRLFVMIEDLLTLSRIEENAFRVSYKPVRMESVIESIVEHNRLLASEHGIDLRLDMNGPLGVCPGDEQQLARAIDNIVGNAVKFTPAGGRIDVGVRRDGTEIVIVVNDTGIGIPVDEQPHLFNRFFRASVAIEQQHGGTGLGLTIAKAIIDHHNGSIRVESKLGHGTTVTVRCPALPVDETINLATA